MKPPISEKTPLELAIERHASGKGGLWDISEQGDREIEAALLKQIAGGGGTFKTRGQLTVSQSAVCLALNHLFERGLIRFVSRDPRAMSSYALTPRGEAAL
jgi:hypothetical protein